MTRHKRLKLYLALILMIIYLGLIIYMVKCPSMTNKSTLSLKNAAIAAWLGGAIFTQVCPLRQGSIPYSTITVKIIQLNISYYCLYLTSYFSALHPLLVISIKMDTERRFEAASPKFSSLPVEGTVLMNRVLMSIKGIYHCLYEVHWQCSMAFY